VSKPFDATLNVLLDARPGDWADYIGERFGLPTGPVEMLDTDLSTTLQADRLLKVNADPPFALHLEIESSGGLGVPERLLRYNVNAWAANDLPVHSVVVLLRPKANPSDLTGELVRTGAAGREVHRFRYDVLRVWKEPMADLLAGLGLAPLAVLTTEATANPPAALARLAERLQQPDVSDKLRDAMLGASFFLNGLYFDRDYLIDLYRRLPMVNLEDSSTYRYAVQSGLDQGIRKGLAEGLAEGSIIAFRGLILRLGTKKLGSPDAATVSRVTALADIDELERLSDRLLDVATWAELFAVT
jgi:hypothetical protein